MAFISAMSAIVQGGLLRVVIPKFGPARCAYFGVSATSVAFIGVATAGNSEALYFWCGLSSLGGLSDPSINSILSNQVSDDSQGKLQGIMASMNSIAMIVGPLLLTQTFTYFTSDSAPVYLPGSAFCVAAILTIAASFSFSKFVGCQITQVKTHGLCLAQSSGVVYPVKPARKPLG